MREKFSVTIGYMCTFFENDILLYDIAVTRYNPSELNLTPLVQQYII